MDFPVKSNNSIEPILSWGELCKNPSILIAELAKRFFVSIDKDQIFENIIISSTIPSSDNRSKVWIKTSWPYGIGIIADGEYKMDYGMSGFPVNIPFLHKEIVTKPAYVEQIGSITMKEYGIEDFQTKEGASKRMLWYMFNPPRITL